MITGIVLDHILGGGGMEGRGHRVRGDLREERGKAPRHTHAPAPFSKVLL